MKQQNHSRSAHSTVVVVVAAAVTIIATTGTYSFTPSVNVVSSGIQNPIDIRARNRVSGRNQLFANNDPNHYSSLFESTTSTRTDKNKVSTQPTPVLLEAIHNFQNNLKVSSSLSTSAATIALSALLVTSTLLVPTNSADAVMSGGRMGGSFSSPSSSRSSYGGGRSSSYGGGRSSSSYSPSRSYSNNNYYYSRPSSTIVAPIFVPSPFAPAVPYYGGGYGGGAGVISYNRGPSFLDILFIGGIGLFVLKTISDTTRSAIDGTGTSLSSSWTSSDDAISALGTGSSVVQISIALNVPNRDDPNSILNVLNRLAETSKTDSRVGVQQLTSSVAIELLRRKSSFTGGYTQALHYDNTNTGQRQYNQLSVQERSKFEKELVSKFSGIDYNRQTSFSTKNSGGNKNALSSSSSSTSTMAVVTILLNIAGDTTSNNIPKTIRSTKDLEKALQQIASDVIIDNSLTSAEILWTPEDRSESLSIRDIIVDYPELRNV